MEKRFSRNCKDCNKHFTTNLKWQKFCSNKCRMNFEIKQYRKYNPLQLKISAGTKGTIGELRVAVDLLQKGYEVFRSLSPSCSCDLAILKNDKLIRIEVRTAYYSAKEDKYLFPKPNNKFDNLALVLVDKIIYKPDLS